MKKYLIYLFAAAFLGTAFLPLRARAAGSEAFQIDGAGNVTIISRQAADDGGSTISFSLYVDSPNAADVEFRFQEGGAKVQEFRYHPDEKKLTVYVAGADALFAADTASLTVGRVVALDRDGSAASASVSVVKDSFQYVYGTELKQVADMELPGVVQTEGTRPKPQATPSGQQEPASQPSHTEAPPKEDDPGDESQEGGDTAQDGNHGQQTSAPTRTGAPIQTGAPAKTSAPIQTSAPARTGTPIQTSAPAKTSPPIQTGAPAQTGGSQGNGGSGDSSGDGQEAPVIQTIPVYAGDVQNDVKKSASAVWSVAALALGAVIVIGAVTAVIRIRKKNRRQGS